MTLKTRIGLAVSKPDTIVIESNLTWGRLVGFSRSESKLVVPVAP